jgi:single-strand DNA-binding protein
MLARVMDSYHLSGRIKAIMDQVTFPSGFTKREFVVTTEDKFPQDIKLELIKDKCSLIDGYAANEEVTVSFNIRGNENNGRYYVNLQAWKVDKGIAAGQSHEQQPMDDGPPPEFG